MKKNRWICSETGQAMVEFALILPILILLLMLPIEYHRVIKTKLLLDTAASDALLHTEGQFQNRAAYEKAAETYILKAYGSAFEHKTPKVEIEMPKEATQETYVYQVYTSEKANEDYKERFEKRNSNFKTIQVSMQLSTEVVPITLIGKAFLKDRVQVHTRKYTRNIYVEGYQKDGAEEKRGGQTL